MCPTEVTASDMAGNSPLQAHSWPEIHYYLRVTACPACGKGPWRAEPGAPAEPSHADAATPAPIVLSATCEACGHSQGFCFAGPAAAAEQESQSSEHLPPSPNPTDEPSRIIDVGQWLSLFHLLIQTAGAESDKAAARRIGYQAAQCLAEALKFYGEDELPAPSAVWTPATRTALRDHPERFARQRLRDMQAKLPSLVAMAHRVEADRIRASRRRWWQFWKRR